MKNQTTTISLASLNTKTIFFYSTILVLPMLNHANQIIVGSAVNLMLFLGAKKLTDKELTLLAVLPSLGAIANGVLFGSFTLFLIYFLPFIWLGNYLMMQVFRKLKYAELIKVFLASLVKTLLLFSAAFIFVKSGLVPSIFLKAMSLIQLITAVSGGVLASLISNSKFFATKIESEK
ncbi:MAG: hypothetical protein IT416_02800 [Candidatus Pacebacteria bacterium]|nr:hypothetical protein [Candidatus Paceibacterota bacterium]